MTNAQFEQKKFWSLFEKNLAELGDPFSVCYRMGGEVRFFGAINKNSARVACGLLVDILCRERIVKVYIYIENDTRLFDFLYRRKEQIEKELGFKPVWVLKGTKNPNTRRIMNTFPVCIGDGYDYDRVIKKVIPYVTKYKTVFEKYIPNLFDFQ